MRERLLRGQRVAFLGGCHDRQCDRGRDRLRRCRACRRRRGDRLGRSHGPNRLRRRRKDDRLGDRQCLDVHGLRLGDGSRRRHRGGCHGGCARGALNAEDAEADAVRAGCAEPPERAAISATTMPIPMPADDHADDREPAPFALRRALRFDSGDRGCFAKRRDLDRELLEGRARPAAQVSPRNVISGGRARRVFSSSSSSLSSGCSPDRMTLSAWRSASRIACALGQRAALSNASARSTISARIGGTSGTTETKGGAGCVADRTNISSAVRP